VISSAGRVFGIVRFEEPDERHDEILGLLILDERYPRASAVEKAPAQRRIAV
jgi:hypothetical protein